MSTAYQRHDSATEVPPNSGLRFLCKSWNSIPQALMLFVVYKVQRITTHLSPPSRKKSCCDTGKLWDRFKATQDSLGEFVRIQMGAVVPVFQLQDHLSSLPSSDCDYLVSKGEYVAIVVFLVPLFFHRLPRKIGNATALNSFRALLKTQPCSDFWENNSLGVCYECSCKRAVLQEAHISSNSLHLHLWTITVSCPEQGSPLSTSQSFWPVNALDHSTNEHLESPFSEDWNNTYSLLQFLWDS